MSHNSAGHVPYITEYTTALSTAGAGQSLVIKGSLLGLSAVVDIPSALGVETARTFTKTGATAGVLTITLTVESLPSTAAGRSIPVSMGGVPCQGVGVTAGAITVTHGFIPTNLTSLVAWYDAADTSTLTIDTSDDGTGNPKNLVGQWDDKSGNGFHAVQGTEINKPKYHASGGGIGQQHIQFGHDDPNFSSFVIAGPTTWAAVSPGGYQNTSIFAVLHVPGTSVHTSNNIVYFPAPERAFRIQDPDGIAFYSSGLKTPGSTAASSLPSKFLVGWLISDSEWIARLNGSIDGTTSGGGWSNVAQTHSNWRINRGGHRAHFEISELLIFDTELTGTDLSKVEGYLNAKWSIY